jgi:NAD(P)-dependent dehydrogenase (short-subunit alcohol dehydrogenase family)
LEQETLGLRLHGTVVVTGAGSGIGRASALAAGRLGAAVGALDLNRAAAEATAAEALDLGSPGAIGLECDVREEASVAAAISVAAERLGPIRGLATCAGIERHAVVHELDWSEWSDVVGTNLNGTFLTCKHVLGSMVEHGQGGSIVCISSALATVSIPGGFGAYSASKGGVSALVRSMALDYAAFSIRVNAVVPGATETPLMWSMTPPEDVPAERAAVEAKVALGRLAEPEEIAVAITWLLSDQATYVTGSHLYADGGLTARAVIDS